MPWKVLVEGSNLDFSAAHFVTFERDCEPLHGHNYAVRLDVSGPLSAQSMVLDFILMKDVIRTLCKALDHKFILPLQNPHLTLTEHADTWEIVYAPEAARDFLARVGAIRYVMPKWSVALLAADNVTAERLAEHLAMGVRDELRRRGAGADVEELMVTVYETPAQAAVFSLRLAPS